MIIWAPIHYSAFTNDIGFIELLVQHGANVNIPGSIGVC